MMILCRNFNGSGENNGSRGARPAMALPNRGFDGYLGARAAVLLPNRGFGGRLGARATVLLPARRLGAEKGGDNSGVQFQHALNLLSARVVLAPHQLCDIDLRLVSQKRWIADVIPLLAMGDQG